MDTALSEPVSYVKTILNQLTRISIAIRKSGAKYRFERADEALNEADFDDFRKHLTTLILMRFEDLENRNLSAVEKVHRASDFKRLSQVQRRLVHANILRRNRIERTARSGCKNEHREQDEGRVQLERMTPSTNTVTPEAQDTAGKSDRKSVV